MRSPPGLRSPCRSHSRSALPCSRRMKIDSTRTVRSVHHGDVGWHPTCKYSHTQLTAPFIHLAPHGPCPVFERRFRSLQIASQDRAVKLTHTIKLATLTAPYMLTMKRGEEATTKAIIVTSCGPNRPKQIVLPYSAIPSTYRPAVFHRVHTYGRAEERLAVGSGGMWSGSTPLNRVE